jgi:DNA-binding response OmpR family regulator
VWTAGRWPPRGITIVQHLWDQSFENLTNIVDVYVRYLRAKIDDAFPAKLVRTVCGAGYSISDSIT